MLAAAVWVVFRRLVSEVFTILDVDACSINAIMKKSCNHENNVPSHLSPQWLCGNSCTCAHDVHLQRNLEMPLVIVVWNIFGWDTIRTWVITTKF